MNYNWTINYAGGASDLTKVVAADFYQEGDFLHFRKLDSTGTKYEKILSVNRHFVLTIERNGVYNGANVTK